MNKRFLLQVLALIVSTDMFALFPRGGGRYSGPVHSTERMSAHMQNTMMIAIGVIAFIVFLYGVKYWKKR